MPGSGDLTGAGPSSGARADGDDARHRPGRRRVAVDGLAGPQRRRAPPCRSPPHTPSGSSTSPIASATGPTRWPAACAAPRRCCSASSSGRSPTRSSPPAVEAVSIAARERNYNVVLGSAHGLADEAIELARRAGDPALRRDHRLRRHARPAAPARRPRRRTFPSSPCGRARAYPGVDTVNVDNRAGIASAVDHLVDLGHRRFGFIGGYRTATCASGGRRSSSD